MNSSFENFCPKLKTGRVIPKGAQIIFETDSPYNQIIMPMALADLVILCNGQFSIRQIIEKFYQKRGTVPFKSILKTLHALHQNGFFENGHELSMNAYLRSWTEPRNARPWSLSWRFGQRIIADQHAPTVFYVLTLILLAGSLFGMQEFPAHPIELIQEMFTRQSPDLVLFQLLICGSILQSVRHLIRGVQLLLLTGKAYNVALRLSPWGLHLYVGDEANDLFENRLYTSMFHLSQIILGWSFLFVCTPFLDASMIQTLTIVNLMVSIWEMNPFVQSEGLRLIRSLTVHSDREVVSWHYDSDSIFKSLGNGYTRQDQDFARICATWGSAWLLMALVILSQTAATFAVPLLGAIVAGNYFSLFAIAGLWAWFYGLYAVSQAFVETIVLSVVRPWWWRFEARLKDYFSRDVNVGPKEVVTRIQDLPLFSHFSYGQLLSILSKTEVTEVPQKTRILQAGEMSREFYVLLEGEIEIVHNPGQTDEWSTYMQATSIFGEAALLDESPRAIQVTTTRKSLILELPVQNVRATAQESNAIRQLEDFRNAILVNQFFASSPVFRSLSQESIDFLCSRGALEYADQDHVVFRQGDMGESIYLVLRGSVSVEVNGNVVTQPKQGSFFGEISLIANIPRTSTVRCNEPSVFFRISSDAFWEVLVQNLDLGVFIETVSENRLREDLKIAMAELPPTGSDD